MACLAFQPSILLNTRKLRPSSASLPSAYTNIRFALPNPTPPGPGHAEHHSQSLFSPGTSHSPTELGQWLQCISLGGSRGSDPHLRTFLARPYNSQTADTARSRCGIVTSSFSFASSVDTHIRLFVDDQYSSR